MKRFNMIGLALLTITFTGAALPAADPPRGLAGHPRQARTKTQILADIAAIKVPQPDQTKVSDQAYVAQFIKERNVVVAKRSELAAELLKVAPEARESFQPLMERWQFLAQNQKGDEASAEIGEFLAKAGESQFKQSAASLRAQIVIQLTAKDTATRLAAIEDYKKYAAAATVNQMIPQMLYATARMASDPKEKTDLMDRIVKEFPDSPVVQMLEGERKKAEAVGKPMVLAFTDVTSGKQMSIEGLKGKIVVMDFWATWCAACIAEMPNMKKLYAEFKDKGVEFVGISLDQPEAQGGLKALKEYIAKNEITWPQYYQGNYWQSEFSKGWGINAIPALFVIGPDGKIVSTEARGQLETLLPELIKKRDTGGVQ